MKTLSKYLIGIGVILIVLGVPACVAGGILTDGGTSKHDLGSPAALIGQIVAAVGVIWLILGAFFGESVD